ncbi:hypothetical protein [Paenibacillus cremeus]|uniref:Uncharacterized protein n=1 Tax=Paenibacillus cremeus TaxID=2163881 RepID=A0A559K3Z8_9BACL|nr:hypothetical protein [Paenibacillus cremeus]TVY06827.1 hypothetical protein FPZ49_27510 [Paenibacillus cremeus]
MNTSNDKSLSKDSTIYTYRLLKRVHHKFAYLAVLWLLPSILLLWDLLQGWPLLLLFCFIGVLLAHTLFIRLYFKMKAGHFPKEWRWSFRLPWFGLVPGSYLALARMRNLHAQLLWINMAILCCLYPWCSTTILAHLAFVHLWLLVPRLFIFTSMRKFSSSGYLKINEKDTSCYAQ